jgi:hypothetical protein
LRIYFRNVAGADARAREARVEIAGGLRGLEQYGPAFRDNDIGLDLLRNLTVEDLRDLGVTSVGQRRRDLLDPTATDVGAEPYYSLWLPPAGPSFCPSGIVNA